MKRTSCIAGFPLGRRIAWASALLTAVVSAGCATARVATPTPKTDVPQAWSRSVQGVVAGADDLSRWWDRLGDQTLSGLVDQALKNNPDVRTARARLRQARAQRTLAHANRFPSVSASGSASANKSSNSDGTGTFAASIDASWEPDVFGGLKASERAAAADYAASEEDLHNTQVSLAAEVAVNYVDLRGGQTRLAIAKANAASQAETLQITEWRAQAGLVGSVDVEQARTSLAQTQASIPSLESSIAQTQHTLAVLLGLPPAALAETLAAAAAIPLPPDRVAMGIPAETLRQRPDIRSAERTIVAEAARLEKTTASRYPSFGLNGSLGLQAVQGGLSGGTSLVASLAASLAQTVFDAGRIRAQIEGQSAVLDQAVISYESTVLTALQDVENALVSFEKSRARLASLTTAVEAARAAAVLARQQYEAGTADFQTVLETQRSVLSAEDSVASTQVDRITAVIQLYKALGGGWSQDQPAAAASNAGGRS